MLCQISCPRCACSPAIAQHGLLLLLLMLGLTLHRGPLRHHHGWLHGVGKGDGLGDRLDGGCSEAQHLSLHTAGAMLSLPLAWGEPPFLAAIHLE